jgi:hypothetical protein
MNAEKKDIEQEATENPCSLEARQGICFFIVIFCGYLRKSAS